MKKNERCLKMISKQQSFSNNLRTMLIVDLFIIFATTTNVVQGATNSANSMSIGSPCPNVFQYNWDGQDWYGVIIAPSLPYGTSARLIARLSIGTVLPTKYAGSLELIGARAEILHSVLTEQPIRYKVHFPLSNPLPVVTTITLNEKLICSGPTVSGPIVTSITLEHVLYPHGKVLNSRDHIISSPSGGQFIPDHMMINHTGTPSTYPDPTIKLNDDAPDDNINNNHSNNVREININPVASNFDLNLNRNNKPLINTVEKNILFDVCGTSVSITALIANGEATKRGSHPWLVALFAQKSLGLEFTCGGTLISNRYVLTAAHCIRYGENRALTPEEVVIILGKYHIRRWTERGSVVREAAKIIMHPDYRVLSGDADLAAIELAEAVLFTDTIRPVCLDTTVKVGIGEDLAGTEGIIVGWGRDETSLKVTPEPRQVRVKIVSQEDCLRSRLEYRYITSNRTLCAGGITPDSGPCSGDSGGGLFVRNNQDGKWFLRGVISMSLADPVSKSCDLKHFSVFVDISKFNGWLRHFLI